MWSWTQPLVTDCSQRKCWSRDGKQEQSQASAGKTWGFYTVKTQGTQNHLSLSKTDGWVSVSWVIIGQASLIIRNKIKNWAKIQGTRHSSVLCCGLRSYSLCSPIICIITQACNQIGRGWWWQWWGLSVGRGRRHQNRQCANFNALCKVSDLRYTWPASPLRVNGPHGKYTHFWNHFKNTSRVHEEARHPENVLLKQIVYST